MTDRFDICVNFILQHECTYSSGAPIVEHDPNDPGGTTFCGIDQRDHPNVHVEQLNIAGVKEIYRALEWTKAKCANFKPPWDLAIFDSAVNPGLGFVGKAVQRSVGGIVVDGFIGPKTIAAVNASARDALARFLNLREIYYHERPEELRKHYLTGWINRLNDLRKACGV